MECPHFSSFLAGSRAFQLLLRFPMTPWTRLAGVCTILQTRVQEAIDAARLGQLKMIAAMDKGRDYQNTLAVGNFCLPLIRNYPYSWSEAFSLQVGWPLSCTGGFGIYSHLRTGGTLAVVVKHISS